MFKEYNGVLMGDHFVNEDYIFPKAPMVLH